MAQPRVLVIEDNPLSATLMHDLLTHHGFDVTLASTAEDARVAWRTRVPDIILMDVEIPGGGGEALLRDLRQAPELRALPVMAVTAQAMQGDRERLLAAGFDAYVAKPIDTRALPADVSMLLAQGRRA